LKELVTNFHDTKKSVLVTISDGLLETHILQELKSCNFQIKVLARNRKRAQKITTNHSEIIEAVVTLPDTMKGKLEGINTVILTSGMSLNEKNVFNNIVDYQGNINLLQEAKSAGVEKFIFLTSIFSNLDVNPKTLKAYNEFITLLRKSGIAYTIIHVNKTVSCLSNNLDIARKPRITFSNKKTWQEDKIHPKNLAISCINAIQTNFSEISIGKRKSTTRKKVLKISYKVPSKSLHSIVLSKYLNEFIRNVMSNFKTSRN